MPRHRLLPFRARGAAFLAAVLLVAAVATVAEPFTAGRTPRAGAATTTAPFRGLGAWVDVYDYAPAFVQKGTLPSVTPASVADMAHLGVRTLYLQAAQDDSRSKGDLVDRRLVARFVAAAHDRGIRVVAWYLPTLGDVDADLRRIRALAEFSSGGDEFDGVALDLESTSTVSDVAERNKRLVELSSRARDLVDGAPLGAIVLEPVLLEVVNPDYWPSFPWRRIRADYDVWLPMTYWTNRTTKSGYREGFRYTDENIRRLRANLGDKHAPVHPIGGIADAFSTDDVVGFIRAAREQHAIGWSVYDYATTTSGLWPRLRAGR